MILDMWRELKERRSLKEMENRYMVDFVKKAQEELVYQIGRAEQALKEKNEPVVEEAKDELLMIMGLASFVEMTANRKAKKVLKKLKHAILVALLNIDYKSKHPVRLRRIK